MKHRGCLALRAYGREEVHKALDIRRYQNVGQEATI